MSRTWLAHEHPDRSFDEWTWLDDCSRCRLALAREAVDRPRLVICVQTTTDRIYVTAEYLHDVVARGGNPTSLSWGDGGRLRGMFVVPDDRLWPPARWRSLSWEADERRAGRTPACRTVAAIPRRGMGLDGLMSRPA
jgi:hypothetical protein